MSDQPSPSQDPSSPDPIPKPRRNRNVITAQDVELTPQSHLIKKASIEKFALQEGTGFGLLAQLGFAQPIDGTTNTQDLDRKIAEQEQQIKLMQETVKSTVVPAKSDLANFLEKRKSLITCSLCKQGGHNAKYCPKLRASVRRSVQQKLQPVNPPETTDASSSSDSSNDVSNSPSTLEGMSEAQLIERVKKLLNDELKVLEDMKTEIVQDVAALNVFIPEMLSTCKNNISKSQEDMKEVHEILYLSLIHI
eukprot:TRINITY_DN4404_c0_g2_i1.p1 TRINITY_DN4404_c0_g2~~TRINITY_DN4404_c0_g2_i1.p1  ORF type:complete len:277 (+),score=60.29 TRINITY_DN4404_c0_g2_i1:84-833(+)